MQAPAKESTAASENSSVEPATGLAFPLKLSPSLDDANVADGGKKGAKDARQLAGVGVRRKRLFGIAELKVYAFGESKRMALHRIAFSAAHWELWMGQRQLLVLILQHRLPIHGKACQLNQGFLDLWTAALTPPLCQCCREQKGLPWWVLLR